MQDDGVEIGESIEFEIYLVVESTSVDGELNLGREKKGSARMTPRLLQWTTGHMIY